MSAPKTTPLAVTLRRLSAAAFEATNAAGATLVLDGPPSVGGVDAGLRPMELCLTALAGCSAVDVLMILGQQKQPLEELDIRVLAQRADAVPSVFTELHVHFSAGGDVAPNKLDRAVQLSADKYCSVSRMLSAGGVVVTHGTSRRLSLEPQESLPLRVTRDRTLVRDVLRSGGGGGPLELHDDEAPDSLWILYGSLEAPRGAARLQLEREPKLAVYFAADPSALEALRRGAVAEAGREAVVVEGPAQLGAAAASASSVSGDAVRAEASLDAIAQARLRGPSALEEQARTLAERVALLESALERAQARREREASLLHDLSSPLSSLQLGLSSLELKSRVPGATLDGPLQTLQRTLTRTTSLFEELKELARTRAGVSTPSSREGLPLPDTLRGLVAEFEAQAAARGVLLVADLEAELPARALPGVERAVANLLDNALRYSPPGAQVSLRARATSSVGQGLSIEVEDQGPGVAREHRPHLFERGWRAAGQGHPGHGLGLAIARELVQAAGGTLHLLETPASSGALFRITLP